MELKTLTGTFLGSSGVINDTTSQDGKLSRAEALEATTMANTIKREPLLDLSPDEVDAKWKAGELTFEDVYRYTTIKRMQTENLLDLEPDEIEYLWKQNYLKDTEVESYVEYHENPTLFYIKDLGRGIKKGFVDAGKELTRTAYELVSLIDEDGAVADFLRQSAEGYSELSEDVAKPLSFLGKTSEPLTEFGVGYALSSKALKGLKNASKLGELAAQAPKLAKFVETTVASIGADLFTIDPYEERLSDVIQEYPSLANPITEYLKSDLDDSLAEAKLKTALEDVALGFAFEGATELLLRSFKFLKAKIWAKNAENYDDVAKEVNKKLKVQEPEKVPVEEPKKVPKEEPEVVPKEEPKKAPVEDLHQQSLFQFTKEDFDTITREIYEEITGRPAPRHLAELSDFNIEKLRNFTLDEALDLIETVSTKIKDEVDRISGGRVISFEQADRAARRIAGKWGAEGNLLFQARKFANDTTGLMARVRAFDRIMTRMAEKAVEAAKLAKKEGSNEAYLQAAAVLQTYAEFQAAVKAGQRNIARSLAVKRMARPGFSDADLRIVPELLEQIEKEGNRKNLARLKQLVDQVTEAKNLKQVAHYARLYGRYRWLRGLVELKQSALLSGWATHVANVMGTTLATTVDSIELMAGLTLDAAVKRDLTPVLVGGGKYLKGFTEGFIEALRLDKEGFLALADAFRKGAEGVEGSAWQKLVAKKEAANEAIRKTNLGTVWKAAFTGEAIIDPFLKFEGQNIGVIPDFAWLPLGSIIRLPFRFLTAADEFFKTVAYHSQKNVALFHELYTVRGLRGKELEKQFRYYSRELPEKIHLRALLKSRELTFTEDSQTAKTLAKLLDPAPTAHPAAQFFGPIGKLMLLPFYKVAVNLFTWTGRRTPLALAFGKQFREDVAAGGFRAYQAYARLATGTALLYLGWNLYKSGRITGRIPQDKKNVAASQGVQEYSIYDSQEKKWISYKRLDPIAMFLALGANLGMLYDYYEAEQSEEGEDLFKASLLAVTDALTSKTWLEGVHQALTILTDPEKMNFGKFLANNLSTMFPFEAAAREYQRLQDPVARVSQDLFTVRSKFVDLQEAWDAFWTKHVDSGKLLPKRDPIFGTPVAQANRHWTGGWETTMKDDPVRMELQKVGASIGTMSDRVSMGGQTVKLTPEQYNRALALVSELGLYERLEQTIQDPRYKAIPDPNTKAEMLSKIVSATRRAAKAALLKEDKTLFNQLKEKLQKQQDVLLGLAQPELDPELYLRYWMEMESLTTE